MYIHTYTHTHTYLEEVQTQCSLLGLVDGREDGGKLTLLHARLARDGADARV